MLTGVSTDGKRLSLSKFPCEVSKDEDMLLLAPALKELGKITAGCGEDEMVKILTDGATTWFVLEKIEFSVRRVESTFPKFEKILNTDVVTTLRIESENLISSLERVDIIAKTTPAHIMAMSLNPNGELKITARAPEFGTASETLNAEIGGSSLQIGFNVAYFLDGLKAIGKEVAVIEFSGEEGQTRMKREGSDDFLYMLMPARLSTQDIMTEEEQGDFKTDEPEQPQELQAESNPENNPENQS